jgi:hypothetical protein
LARAAPEFLRQKMPGVFPVIPLQNPELFVSLGEIKIDGLKAVSL